MAGFGFTKDQLEAIETSGCDILVAAAAGSGKTAVLVERIIQMVTHQEKPIHIDRLLVVTFTDAAASEMRQRIAKALVAKLEEDPDNEHLQKQIPLLNKAAITTIHSFCLKVIRQNFHLLDIDPGFRIADQTEITLLQREVLEELFEAEYELEDNEVFYQLVEYYGERLRDYQLQELILSIAHFVESSPWPEKWIQEAVSAFSTEHVMPFEQTRWFLLIQQEIQQTMMGVLDNIQMAEKICVAEEGLSVYLENLYDDRTIAERIMKACEENFEKVYQVVNEISFTRLKAIKKEVIVDDVLKDKVKEIRDKEIKEEIQKLKTRFFFQSPQEMMANLVSMGPILEKLGFLVLEFGKRYTEKKKEKNIVDFSDLEHFCLKILLAPESDENNRIPTAKAIEIGQQFEEILIDEYQDSNLVQEIILSSIAKKNPSNRFMVGDIKQSIYKFRKAKPELFMEKYATFGRIVPKENHKIDLSKNFRSRSCVLSSVNFLFTQMMTEKLGEVCYDEAQALNPAATFLENEEQLLISEDTEVHVIESKTKESPEETEPNEIEEIGKVELEAKVIAKRILELVYGEKKLYVVNGGKYRPAQFSDIVILVRSLTSTAELLLEELKKYNIPAIANTSEGYFDAIEVQTMLSFLQIIDNPIQDIHLLTVLRSPVYGVESEELLEIRSMDKSTAFYMCVELYISDTEEVQNKINPSIKEKLSRFYEDLEYFRGLAVYTPIHELLWCIYQRSQYFNYVGVMPGGTIRQANLRTLQERAMQYENTSYKSLFHFIKYIEKLQRSEADAGNAKLLSENDNVVRIMTIHKSKGLEFPVVFVSFLGKNFNLMDERKSLLLHSELGFGPIYMDLEQRTKNNTLARAAIARKIHLESLSEELRVLYVALTRAKEKLILTGTIPSLEKGIEKYGKYLAHDAIQLPLYAMIKSKCFFDFILPAVARHQDGTAFHAESPIKYNTDLFRFDTRFQVFFCSLTELQEQSQEKEEIHQKLWRDLHLLDIHQDYSGDKAALRERLEWQYPHQILKNLPTKVSISEIKRHFYEQSLENSVENILSPPVFSLPTFMQTEKRITSVQRGTIIHTVVQHLQLQEHTTKEKIEMLLKQLVQRNIISEAECAVVPIGKILKYVHSPLANRMRHSSQIKKEVPFVVGLSPKEVYGDARYEDRKETILLHGMIDCYFYEGDGVVLVDYKTDYVTTETLPTMMEKYRLQLKIYKDAIEKSTGKAVMEQNLYFFHLDQAIAL